MFVIGLCITLASWVAIFYWIFTHKLPTFDDYVNDTVDSYDAFEFIVLQWIGILIMNIGTACGI